MNYQAHRVAGICMGTVAATYAYQETFGEFSTWDIKSVVTLSVILTGSILGSLLPDIDHPNSKVGRKFPIISRLTNLALGHRGFTHTLLAQIMLIIALFLLAGIVPSTMIGYFYPFSFGVIIGYASHLILDMLTVSGVPLFYPFIKKPIRLAKLRSGRDDIIVIVLLVGLTSSYLYIFL